MDFRTEPLADLAASIANRERSALEVLDHALDRIEALELTHNAWAAIDADGARAEATRIDERIAAGEKVGPLAGIPIGVKDLEDAAGFRTASGSALHVDDPAATADSPLVERLRAAGCVVIGKTTTPEFGWQGDTTSPAFGPTHNPWNLERSPGGSSGGTAAAVAAGMIPLGTGSDGGGSIRIPSALCGLAGFKPTTGRVGLGGAHAPGVGTLAVKGPMARTVRDVAYALDVCVGPVPTDPYSFPGIDGGPGWYQALATPVAPRKVLFAPAPGFTVDAEIASVCRAAVDRIGGAGVEVEVIDRVFADEPLADWFNMWCVLAACRQGDLKGTPDWELIDPGLREQIEYGLSSISALDFARALDATYVHNLDLVAHFEQAPIILCPTVAGQTARCGEQGTVNGEATVFWSPFTPSYNVTRNPAGSIPVGLTVDGMPVGLQVIGAQHDDLGVLHAMAFIEDLLALDLVAPTQ